MATKRNEVAKMNREKFLDMFNILVDTYKPKVLFDTDDYYNQVRYLPDDVLKTLRSRIVEQCGFLPKPAELKKIAQEFQTPYVKKEHPDINYDDCFCGKPVYNAMIDPYRCKECYEKDQERISAEHKRLIDLGLPVDQVCKGDSRPLKNTLEKAMAKLV